MEYGMMGVGSADADIVDFVMMNVRRWIAEQRMGKPYLSSLQAMI